MNCKNFGRKFSGKSCDYGRFEQDFNQIVNVSRRSDIEIGNNLKDAIPEKYRYLVNHLNTADNKEIMKVLDHKFGTKDIVIKDIIGKMELLKAVTNNKMFINFVEKLQKMKLDLEGLGQSAQMANAACIGKMKRDCG